jgi:hypothetical protein
MAEPRFELRHHPPNPGYGFAGRLDLCPVMTAQAAITGIVTEAWKSAVEILHYLCLIA